MPPGSSRAATWPTWTSAPWKASPCRPTCPPGCSGSPARPPAGSSVVGPSAVGPSVVGGVVGQPGLDQLLPLAVVGCLHELLAVDQQVDLAGGAGAQDQRLARVEQTADEPAV